MEESQITNPINNCCQMTRHSRTCYPATYYKKDISARVGYTFPVVMLRIFVIIAILCHATDVLSSSTVRKLPVKLNFSEFFGEIQLINDHAPSIIFKDEPKFVASSPRGKSNRVERAKLSPNVSSRSPSSPSSVEESGIELQPFVGAEPPSPKSTRLPQSVMARNRRPPVLTVPPLLKQPPSPPPLKLPPPAIQQQPLTPPTTPPITSRKKEKTSKRKSKPVQEGDRKSKLVQKDDRTLYYKVNGCKRVLLSWKQLSPFYASIENNGRNIVPCLVTCYLGNTKIFSPWFTGGKETPDNMLCNCGKSEPKIKKNDKDNMEACKSKDITCNEDDIFDKKRRIKYIGICIGKYCPSNGYCGNLLYRMHYEIVSISDVNAVLKETKETEDSVSMIDSLLKMFDF